MLFWIQGEWWRTEKIMCNQIEQAGGLSLLHTGTSIQNDGTDVSYCTNVLL